MKYPISLVVAVAAGCSNPGVGGIPGAFAVTGVAGAPLVRWVSFDDGLPTRVALDWTDPDGTPREAVDSQPSLGHRLHVLGLFPDTAYDLHAVALDPSGAAIAEKTLSFRTDPLPAVFPTIRVDVSDPGAMAPGVTLFELTSAQENNYLVMLDAAGNVRWLLEREIHVSRVLVEAEDRLLLASGDGKLHEIDLDGNNLQTWSPAAIALPGEIPVEATQFAHDLALAADGTLFAMDRGSVVFPSFRTSYDDPTAHAPDVAVMADRVLKIDPVDGSTVREWDLRSVFDPERLGYGSLDLWGTADDWTHANALQPLADGGVLVSARHQDAIAALDAAGHVEWLAANPVGWRPDLEASRLLPETDFPWFYHQHGPDLDEATGQLVLFDNGNVRSSPGDGIPEHEAPSWSRVVALTVDPTARSIREDWSWEPADAPVYSGAEGGVRRLPSTGGDLVTFGYVSDEGGAALASSGLGRLAVRLVELDRAHSPVWQVELSGDAASTPDGWNTFLAERIDTPW